jgi:membrane protein YqaA with SNARE-associated domain
MNKLKYYFHKIKLLLPFLTFILISFLIFYLVTPGKIIEFVGMENAYILMFSSALLGGMTTFNFIPYYSIIILLASAGLNPLYIGISSATGVMVGDTFSYFLGRSGDKIIPESLKKIFEKINNFSLKNPKLFPLLCFIYGSISPFSNDFITISAGVAKISYKKVMLPLALGNLVFNISLAFIAYYFYDFLKVFNYI